MQHLLKPVLWDRLLQLRDEQAIGEIEVSGQLSQPGTFNEYFDHAKPRFQGCKS